MKTYILVFSVFLVTFFSALSAFSGSQASVKNAEFALNRASPGAMQKYQLGSMVTYQKKWVLKGTYDYSVSGGAISTINLKDQYSNTLTLPKGAIVSDCLLDFITAGASLGSATISVSTGQSAADLKSALAVVSATGLVTCVPVGTAATSIKMTADRTPTISIATAALTAGKVNVLIEYWMSDL